MNEESREQIKVVPEQPELNRCKCAYCQAGGMSETIEEYMDKRIELTKRMREPVKTTIATNLEEVNNGTIK